MAYGPGRPYISGYHRLLSSLTAAVLCVHLHVHCQPESTVVVHDSSELASALQNASIASQRSPGTTTIQLTLYSWEVSIALVLTTISVPRRLRKTGGRDAFWLLQADQNADFFVVDRKDFPANETSDILPGQKIILASGESPKILAVRFSWETTTLNTLSKVASYKLFLTCAVPGGPKTLDFAGVTRLLNIMGNGTLEINGLNIRGMASRHLLGAAVIPNLRAVSFAFWPTVIAQPNAKV